jgi:hypothetical protein
MRPGKFRLSLLAAASVACCGVAVAQIAAEKGCNDRILTGSYAFTLEGIVYMPNAEGSATAVVREGIAMTHFDGYGHLTQIDYVLGDGVAQGPAGRFREGESGTYTVNGDCTGTAEIKFPAAPGTSTGALIRLLFVLSNHGETIHTIVSELIPPGATQAIPASIHSEGYKLGHPQTDEDHR